MTRRKANSKGKRASPRRSFPICWLQASACAENQDVAISKSPPHLALLPHWNVGHCPLAQQQRAICTPEIDHAGHPILVSAQLGVHAADVLTLLWTCQSASNLHLARVSAQRQAR